MLKALLNQGLAKSKQTKRVATEKFDKTWGHDAAFEKTVDRTAFEVEGQDQKAQIHDQILVMHKTKNDNELRESFLKRITGDSLDFISEQRARMAKAQQEEQLCHDSMTVMTEQIFELLKSYAYEFNSVLGFGPLHVASTNPKTVSEVLKFNRLRQAEETITFIRARLSTTSFSLVLRGNKDGILFFLLPVARAIGLSMQENKFKPVLRLSTRMQDGMVAWETESGKALTASMIEVICMNLFQQLIDETKSQLATEFDEGDSTFENGFANSAG